MIILFEVNETNFTTLGLGVLTDAIECSVNEKLNDEFSLQMNYPVNGKHFSKIQNNRILYCKPNPYDYAQAFRIYSIAKPINGIITINAVHISYDLNNIPVNAVSGDNLQDLLTKIQNGAILEHNFKFNSSLTSAKTFKTTMPYNLRAILMGGTKSIVSEYEAELKFNNFVIDVLEKRGSSNGAIVRYGHNMTDVNHEASTESLYNGVFPFYHTEKEKNETTKSDEFAQVYIVGSKPLQDGWLSYSKDGEPYHPIDTSPIQIATEGDYYQKVYVWNEIYNIYQEKLYNQTVTVLQGILEPEWISIDWSGFPNIACKAAKKGYFKVATSNDWGDIKGVGDVIFEGSITNSGIMENMVLYFSEVIPTNSESTNTEVAEIIDVQLDSKILWLETSDAKSMAYDKILMIDLTSEFEEEPTKERLQAKAEEFINKNKIGLLKHTTTVSFLDLSSTTEQSKYENFDHIEVGDTVKIIYEDAGISIELRVISTGYDVISKRYSKIELGEKKDTISSESVQNGDSVSSLTNDVGYATVTTVNKLIADVVTANYIEALNAKLTRAQISQLEVERINVSGIIEASQFTIDSLVAKLLVAENADIANVLTAGEIRVAGDITINSGQISIISEEGIAFIVDREGNLTANSVSITGGTFNINDGVFEVTNDGVLTAKDALIIGHIEATTGRIGGFDIIDNQIYTGEFGTGIFLSTGFESATSIGGSSGTIDWAFTVGDAFGVTTSGTVYANDIVIADGSINIGNDEFIVDSTGNVTIKSGSIDIGSGAFIVDTNGNITITGGEIKIEHELVYTITNPALTIGTYLKYRYYYKVGQEYFLSTGDYVPGQDYYNLTSGTYFSVNANGDLETNSITITGGYLDINNGAFAVDNTGNVTIKYGSIDINNGMFEVTSEGAVTASNITITGGSLSIGGTELSPNFSVDSSGNVTIKSGSIDIGAGVFQIDEYGAVTASNLVINGGEITMGYAEPTYVEITLTPSTYIANKYYWLDGDEMTLATDPTYNSGLLPYFELVGSYFSVDDDGNVTANSIIINGGTFNVNGSISIGQNGQVILGPSEINTITGCLSASITNIISNSINSETLYTYNEYIDNRLYFGDDQLTSLGLGTSTLQINEQEVSFTSSYTHTHEAETTIVEITIYPDVTTMANVSININVNYRYSILYNGLPKYINTVRQLNVYIPSGATHANGVTVITIFDIFPPITSTEVTSITFPSDSSPKTLTYYTNTSPSLEVVSPVINLLATDFIKLKMFETSTPDTYSVDINLNRQGLFVDRSVWHTSTNTEINTTLVGYTSAMWNANEHLDTGGPFGIQVIFVDHVEPNSSYSFHINNAKAEVNGVSFQEYGAYNALAWNQVFCTIAPDKKTITIYNSSDRIVHGWCWVMLCYSH